MESALTSLTVHCVSTENPIKRELKGNTETDTEKLRFSRVSTENPIKRELKVLKSSIASTKMLTVSTENPIKRELKEALNYGLHYSLV